MDPFVGEIRQFAFNFVPRGWAACNGQLLPIAQNTALFSLLGTSFGGDGRATFGLPNIIGNLPVGAGQGPGLPDYPIGSRTGVQTVTLNSSQMPTHNHGLVVTNAVASTASASGQQLANGIVGGRQSAIRALIYSTAAPATTLNTGSLASTGSNQAHNNMMPYLAMNFFIAIQGVYPSRP